MNNDELSRLDTISAHEALSVLAAYSTGPLPERVVQGYANEVRKALPPKPQPTMDDVDWERDIHFLAIAEDTRDNQRYIMLFPEISGHIRCITEDPQSYTLALLREFLVPTGERYELVDTQE